MSGAARSRVRFAFTAVVVLSSLVAGVGLAQDDQARFGGTLDVAVPADPATLDFHVTTADATAVAANHWLEPVVAFDSGYVPRPHLAESVSLTDDGQTYTIDIRQGVTFHNGEEMTAEDVAASIRRWLDVSVRASSATGSVEEVRAVDESTVEIQLSQPFAPLLSLMANPNNGAYVYPASVIEAAGDQPIQDHVGTGPYRFAEWIPDRFIRVERYDDYQPVDAEPSLFSGRRTAYFDEIRFIPVPDGATRIAGVEAGEYDYGHRINRDAYAQLEANPMVKTFVTQPDGWVIMLLNKREGPLTNETLRRALNAALNPADMLRAAAGPEEFWSLEHNYMVGDTPFHTAAGSENYNLNDPELARQLAEEAGYDGEPIRWMVSTSHQEHFNASQVGVVQLQEAGFNVEMQPMEWATLLDRRQQAEVWEIFTTTGGFVPDPALLTVITDTYPGWWEDDRRAELVQRLNSATTLEERTEIWNEVQTYIYETMPSIFVGEIYGLQIANPDLQNVVPNRNPFFWNIWMQ